MPVHNKQKSFVLTERYKDYLLALLQHQGLTAEQLVRLFYRPGSLTYVQTQLKELTENKYLLRTPVPHVTSGSTPYIYSLDKRSIYYLSDRDLYIPGYKPFTSANYDTHQHFLTVNDFALAAEKLPSLTSSVTLNRWLHEWQLKIHPVTTRIGNKNIETVHDLLLDFHVLAGSSKKLFRMPLCIEIDRGSEWGKKFKQKLQTIIQLVSHGAYTQWLGYEYPTFAFATSRTTKRRDTIRLHLKDLLEEMGKVQLANLFLFASLTYETNEKRNMKWLDPHQVFFSPIWYTPTSDTPMPLLDLSD